MDTNYSFPVEAEKNFLKAVVTANKRLTKASQPNIEVTRLGEIQVPILKRNGRPSGRFATNVQYKVSRPDAKTNGWTLLGVCSPLQTDEGVVAVVTAAPGREVKDTFSYTDPRICNHCNTKRFRNESYILGHEDGTQKQVGSDCLQAFLGLDSVDAVMACYRADDNLREAVDNFKTAERRFHSDDLNTIWAATIAVIRAEGWVSKKAAMESGEVYKTATAVHVHKVVDLLACKPDAEDGDEAMARWESERQDRHIPAVHLPTEADFTAAAEHRALIRCVIDRHMDEGTMNDYLNTVAVVVVTGVANRRCFGVACSLEAMWMRENSIVLDPAMERLKVALKESKHVAAVGARFETKVTFHNMVTTGTGLLLMTFIDNQNNLLKWFTGGSAGLKAGETYMMKATVRRHDSYKGANQTIINRAVFTPAP